MVADLHAGTAPRQRYQGLIRRNLHITPGPAQTLADLRRLAQHLPSSVTVERPCKAKNQATMSTNRAVSLVAGPLRDRHDDPCEGRPLPYSGLVLCHGRNW